MTAYVYAEQFTNPANMSQVTFVPRALDKSWETKELVQILNRFSSARHMYESGGDVCRILSLSESDIEEGGLMANVKTIIIGSVRKSCRHHMDRELVEQCLQVTRKHLLENVMSYCGIAFTPTYEKKKDSDIYPFHVWAGTIQARLAKWLYNEDNLYPNRGIWIAMEKEEKLSKEQSYLQAVAASKPQPRSKLTLI